MLSCFLTAAAGCADDAVSDAGQELDSGSSEPVVDVVDSGPATDAGGGAAEPATGPLEFLDDAGDG